MIEAKQKIQKTVQNYSFFLDDLLGEGYSSQVYKGINNCTKQIVAIKVINFKTLTSPISQTLLKNEINILKQINHQNIMRVYEVFESRNNTYIICEYCNDGDLANILEKTKLSQIDILSIFSQVVEGIKALHDQKIIHRDIKPANILKSNGVYKLSDFGFAIIENDYESIIKKFSVGTPVYMAPETVQQNQYSEKSDIWSLGVVLYLMLFKELPFNLKKDFDLVTKEQLVHSRIKNEKMMLKKIKDVLIGMLQIDPIKRFNIEMVQQMLRQQKKLNLNQHNSIPCKIIRRVSACDLTDNSDNENAILNAQDLSKPLKTLPDDMSANEDNVSASELRQGKTQRVMGEVASQDKLIGKGVIRINNKAMTVKNIEIQKTTFSTQKTEINYQTCSPLSPEKSKKHIKIAIPQQDFKLKIETKKYEHNEGLLNSNPNSTKDTIKNNSSSNGQSQQNQISSNSPTVQQQIVQQIQEKNRDTSPQFLNQSLRNLVISPLKSKQRKNKFNGSSLSVLPNDKQNLDGFNFLKNQLKKVEFQRNKTRTDLSISNNSDIEKKNGKQKDKEKEKQKEKDIMEQLSASIKPTYKFLVFLNGVLKNFDQINTEEKQKCYFLIRKLLALKASAIKKFCPPQCQSILESWIENFQQYYEKVYPVFYTSQDRKFAQYFNDNLEQFTKGFSQLLFNYLQAVNQQLLSKDLLTIQEVIHENIKQFNDPILFARRWANDQS